MINYSTNQDIFIAIGCNLHDRVYDSYWVVLRVKKKEESPTTRVAKAWQTDGKTIRPKRQEQWITGP